MEYELLGWPPDGPKLQLDYRRFSYAGKFVMTNTGKAVVRDPTDVDESSGDDEADEAGEIDKPNETDGIVAAVAFNEDRTNSDVLWLRYVTVAKDRRGEGIGPELLGFVRDRAIDRGYERLRIAVNNPFAYEALYRAGFAYTGETTGIAELVLEYPQPDGLAADHDGHNGRTEDGTETAGRTRYQDGLEEFRERDLSEAEETFLEERRESDPPAFETHSEDERPSR